MLIAHVRFTVAPENRLQALEALMAGVPAVRSMKGCVAFVPFLEPADETMLGVLHEWESEDDFVAYTLSDAFRNFGAAIRPIMIAPPVSKRFHAQPLEAVN